MVGSAIGPYRVLAKLGEGGMGAVYRAHDTRLQRDVALKVVAADGAGDPSRLARFEQEARTTAALNHPHIVAVHDIGHGPHGPFIVSELLEGETLRERLARGRLPAGTALDIAAQIARGLAAAHDKGIVHRDLKPENIFLTRDGTAKILDFGLAKLRDAQTLAEAARSVTVTLDAPARTEIGMVLGTVGYMAPEQVRGEPVDHRADIFALGCALYEMLTGQRAFTGESSIETLHNILSADPADLASAAGAPLPPGAERIVQRCLEKDRAHRFQSSRDLAFALENAVEMRRASGTHDTTPFASRNRRAALPWMVTAATLAAAVALALSRWHAPSAPPFDAARFEIPILTEQVFTYTRTGDVRELPSERHLLAVSPDGRWVAWVADLELYLRRIDELTPRVVQGTDPVPALPFFSPDSRWLGFWAGGELRRVPVEGGQPLVIAAVAAPPRSVTWHGNRIVFTGTPAPIAAAETATPPPGATPTEDAGLLEVSPLGGVPSLLVARGPDDTRFTNASFVDDRTVLFTARLRERNVHLPYPTGDTWMERLDTRERRKVLDDAVDARYVGEGVLLFTRARTLYAVDFDPTRMAVTGTPRQLVADIEPAPVADGSNYAAAASGALLAYVPLATTLRRELVWVDERGVEEPLGTEPRSYVYPRLSPDGRYIAVDVLDDQTDIWLWDLRRRALTRFTMDGGANQDRSPTWSPDGRRILYYSGQSGRGRLVSRALDGSGDRELARFDGGAAGGAIPMATGFPEFVTADGRVAVSNNADIVLLNIATGATTSLATTPAYEINAELSPDGRWIAYQSNESGHAEVYVRPFPNLDEGRWQVSVGGGTRPAWSRDGRSLFFVSGTRMMRVAVSGSGGFSASAPAALFGVTPYFFWLNGRTFDVAPDGRFVMVKHADAHGSRIVVLQQWRALLSKKESTPRQP